MKNIFLIAKREFLTQVKKKSFIILTLLAPLLMVGFGAIIAFMFKANETEYRFNVIDKSGLFENRLKPAKEITYIPAPVGSEMALKSALKQMKEVDGILVIPELKDNNFEQLQKETELLINKKISFEIRERLANRISDVIKEEKIKHLGLTQQQIKDLDTNFQLKTTNVVDESKQDDDLAFGIKSGLSFILMYVIFMFIMIYGVRVMRSVLEEKNNRVVEIIISSVKPFELMMGKIIGVTGVALVQFGVWITMTLAATTIFGMKFGKVPQTQDIPANELSKFERITGEVSMNLLSMDYGLIIFAFIIYFILGYLFYSSMYAAIGSAVDNETETQQFTMFGIMPLLLGLYGSFSIIKNPDGPLGFWLSIFPMTSPVSMIARIPFGVPIWQLALSIGLLIASTIGMVFIASKIYRVGILSYGNKATMKELWKWIRA